MRSFRRLNCALQQLQLRSDIHWMNLPWTWRQFTISINSRSIEQKPKLKDAESLIICRRLLELESSRRTSLKRWRYTIELDSNAASIDNDTFGLYSVWFFDVHAKRNRFIRNRKRKTGGKRSQKRPSENCVHSHLSSPTSHLSRACVSVFAIPTEVAAQLRCAIKRIRRAFSRYVSILSSTVDTLREQKKNGRVCGVQQVLWQWIGGQFHGNFLIDHRRKTQR